MNNQDIEMQVNQYLIDLNLQKCAVENLINVEHIDKHYIRIRNFAIDIALRGSKRIAKKHFRSTLSSWLKHNIIESIASIKVIDKHGKEINTDLNKFTIEPTISEIKQMLNESWSTNKYELFKPTIKRPISKRNIDEAYRRLNQ